MKNQKHTMNYTEKCGIYKGGTIMNCPCYKCNDRKIEVTEGKVINCHSYCEKYHKYRKALNRINKLKGKEKGVYDYE